MFDFAGQICAVPVVHAAHRDARRYNEADATQSWLLVVDMLLRLATSGGHSRHVTGSLSASALSGVETWSIEDAARGRGPRRFFLFVFVCFVCHDQPTSGGADRDFSRCTRRGFGTLVDERA